MMGKKFKNLTSFVAIISVEITVSTEQKLDPSREVGCER